MPGKKKNEEKGWWRGGVCGLAMYRSSTQYFAVFT